MRKPLPLMLISVFVLIGAWAKRYIIVALPMVHPFLPVEHVPLNFKTYTPTLIEIAITLASFIMVLMIISVLSKLFPILPINEIAKEKGIIEENHTT
jgi:molybdopterin-containing oxidoreductase family membrane subunit